MVRIKEKRGKGGIYQKTNTASLSKANGEMYRDNNTMSLNLCLLIRVCIMNTVCI